MQDLVGGNTYGSIRRKGKTERKEIEESIAKKGKMVPHSYSKHYKYNNQTKVRVTENRNRGQSEQIRTNRGESGQATRRDEGSEVSSCRPN